MPKKGDPDGKNKEASGSKLVKQLSKEAQTDRPQGNPQPAKKSRSPPKGSGAGPSKQGRKSSRSVSTLNPFSCWAGSQIQVQDESPTSIANKIAAAVDSGVLPQPHEDWDRSKIPVENQANRGPNPPPTSEPTALKAAAGTGLGTVSVVVGVGSSSRRPADSPPRDRDPHPSPEYDHEPRPRRTSSAHDRGVDKGSEPVSTPRSAPTSREKIVLIPATTNAPSTPHSTGPSARPSPAANTAGGSTSKLAIACACHKEKGLASRGQPGSQKSKVEARMSRGSGPGPGRGSSRGNDNDQETRRDNVVGLRAARRANAGAGPSRGGRSRSPIPDQREWGDGNNYETMGMLVADLPDACARSSANEPVALGRRANAARRKEPVPEILTKYEIRKRWLNSDGEFRTDAQELGDAYWQEERRRRVVGSGLDKKQKTGNEGRRSRGNPQQIGNFQPCEGDIILRHKKWPNEPMIEFFYFDEEGQSMIREHDHVLRNILQFDRRTDNLLCRARLWRATLVEMADAYGHVGQDLRFYEVGSAEINFDSFRARRCNQGKYIFGRRLEAGGL